MATNPKQSDCKRQQKDVIRERDAIGEVLKVISQSRDDEEPVFDVVLAKVMELCETEFTSLWLVDEAGENVARIKETSRFKKLHDEVGQQDDIRSLTDTGSSVVSPILEKRILHIPDFKETERYRQGAPGRRLVVDEMGIRTVAVAPLLSDDKAIGVLFAVRTEVCPFTNEQIALFETFATQAAIAIENVRQFRALTKSNASLARALDHQTATADVLDVISQTQADAQPVFEAILGRAVMICNSRNASLLLVSEDGERLEVAANLGGSPEVNDWLKQSPTPLTDKDSSFVIALNSKRPVHIEDIRDTERYRKGDGLRRRAVDKDGTRTVLQTPLISRGRGVGVLCVYRNEMRPFLPEEIALIETFAAQAVIAIENARQFRELEDLNAELAARVEEQVREIERMGRLKRFLPTAVANAVVSSGSDEMLQSHRTLLGILFCDIRGFTAFCERAEPEETIEVLQTYHREMGRLIDESSASVDHRMGDGIMLLFNDPIPCEDPAGDAVRLALAMQARMAELCKQWKRLGHRLGFGVGISMGYATVGMVGSLGRQDYTAFGTVVNLASRLCDMAEDGETLLSPRAHIATEDDFDAEPFGEISLKGIQDPLEVFRVIGPRATL